MRTDKTGSYSPPNYNSSPSHTGFASFARSMSQESPTQHFLAPTDFGGRTYVSTSPVYSANASKAKEIRRAIQQRIIKKNDGDLKSVIDTASDSPEVTLLLEGVSDYEEKVLHNDELLIALLNKLRDNFSLTTVSLYHVAITENARATLVEIAAHHPSLRSIVIKSTNEASFLFTEMREALLSNSKLTNFELQVNHKIEKKSWSEAELCARQQTISYVKAMEQGQQVDEVIGSLQACQHGGWDSQLFSCLKHQSSLKKVDLQFIEAAHLNKLISLIKTHRGMRSLTLSFSLSLSQEEKNKLKDALVNNFLLDHIMVLCGRKIIFEATRALADQVRILNDSLRELIAATAPMARIEAVWQQVQTDAPLLLMAALKHKSTFWAQLIRVAIEKRHFTAILWLRQRTLEFEFDQVCRSTDSDGNNIYHFLIQSPGIGLLTRAWEMLVAQRPLLVTANRFGNLPLNREKSQALLRHAVLERNTELFVTLAQAGVLTTLASMVVSSEEAGEFFTNLQALHRECVAQRHSFYLANIDGEGNNFYHVVTKNHDQSLFFSAWEHMPELQILLTTPNRANELPLTNSQNESLLCHAVMEKDTKLLRALTKAGALKILASLDMVDDKKEFFTNLQAMDIDIVNSGDVSPLADTDCKGNNIFHVLAQSDEATLQAWKFMPGKRELLSTPNHRGLFPLAGLQNEELLRHAIVDTDIQLLAGLAQSGAFRELATIGIDPLDREWLFPHLAGLIEIADVNARDANGNNVYHFLVQGDDPSLLLDAWRYMPSLRALLYQPNAAGLYPLDQVKDENLLLYFKYHFILDSADVDPVARAALFHTKTLCLSRLVDPERVNALRAIHPQLADKVVKKLGSKSNKSGLSVNLMLQGWEQFMSDGQSDTLELQRIDVSYNNLNSADFKRLAKMICRCPTLTEVDLSGNPLLLHNPTEDTNAICELLGNPAISLVKLAGVILQSGDIDRFIVVIERRTTSLQLTIDHNDQIPAEKLNSLSNALNCLNRRVELSNATHEQPDLHDHSIYVANSANDTMPRKLLKGETILAEEQLTDEDLKRLITAIGGEGLVKVVDGNAASLAQTVALDARDKIKQTQPYQLAYLVNMGGNHWIRLYICVTPRANKLIARFIDSFAMTSEKEKRLTDFIKQVFQCKVEYQQRDGKVITTQVFSSYHRRIEACNGKDEPIQQDSWSCGYRAVKGLTHDGVSPLAGLTQPNVHWRQLHDCSWEPKDLRDSCYRVLLSEYRLPLQSVSLQQAPLIDWKNKADAGALRFKGKVIDSVLEKVQTGASVTITMQRSIYSDYNYFSYHIRRLFGPFLVSKTSISEAYYEQLRSHTHKKEGYLNKTTECFIVRAQRLEEALEKLPIVLGREKTSELAVKVHFKQLTAVILDFVAIQIEKLPTTSRPINAGQWAAQCLAVYRQWDASEQLLESPTLGDEFHADKLSVAHRGFYNTFLKTLEMFSQLSAIHATGAYKIDKPLQRYEQVLDHVKHLVIGGMIAAPIGMRFFADLCGVIHAETAEHIAHDLAHSEYAEKNIEGGHFLEAAHSMPGISGMMHKLSHGFGELLEVVTSKKYTGTGELLTNFHAPFAGSVDFFEFAKRLANYVIHHYFERIGALATKEDSERLARACAMHVFALYGRGLMPEVLSRDDATIERFIHTILLWLAHIPAEDLSLQLALKEGGHATVDQLLRGGKLLVTEKEGDVRNGVRVPHPFRPFEPSERLARDAHLCKASPVTYPEPFDADLDRQLGARQIIRDELLLLKEANYSAQSIETLAANHPFRKVIATLCVEARLYHEVDFDRATIATMSLAMGWQQQPFTNEQVKELKTQLGIVIGENKALMGRVEALEEDKGVLMERVEALEKDKAGKDEIFKEVIKLLIEVSTRLGLPFPELVASAGQQTVANNPHSFVANMNQPNQVAANAPPANEQVTQGF